ncbi:MAG: hypothetical protein HZA94_00110 [Candidatus Vogelbacteria bacterium]|nr:hypothetical protein [Candidatus Vogelbacteria bacterium]
MEDEINFLDYWQILVKRKQIIIGLIIIMSLVAFIHAIKQPSLYKATNSIMLVDSGGGGLAATLAFVPFLGGAGGGGGLEKLPPILGSNVLAQQVVANIDINKYFSNQINLSLNDDKKNKIAAEILQEAISSSFANGLFLISAVWNQPEQAAEIANIYMTELGKFLNKRGLNINFQVIDPAVPSKARFSPKIRQEVMLGAVLGGFLGIFLAFVLEFIPVPFRQK